ncbi:glycoside hydrolase Endo-1,4-beta-glucanase of family GH6 [Gracilaria domingensis]|nr:glycoside hydrolase Endo-1,4-beta-glucanase of family GH6 [Gracilaria domingensis]
MPKVNRLLEVRATRPKLHEQHSARDRNYSELKRVWLHGWIQGGRRWHACVHVCVHQGCSAAKRTKSSHSSGKALNMIRNPLAGQELDVVEQQVDRWIRFHREDWRADIFRTHLANKPVFHWVGDWVPDIRRHISRIVNHARANQALFQIVVYNIPNRDAGGFSAGGAASRREYMQWIRALASAIGSGTGILCIEPDALAHAQSFTGSKKESRIQILREVVLLLRRRCKNAFIYLDVGHPDWLSAGHATELFLDAGGRFAHGISLNVSNSQTSEDCFNYGLTIVRQVSAYHGMIIDTSRNGAGPPPRTLTGTEAWANVPTNRLGMHPTLRVKPPNIFNHRLHGLLWIKVPGESDGNYRGAPHAGQFWPEGALRLIRGDG